MGEIFNEGKEIDIALEINEAYNTNQVKEVVKYYQTNARMFINSTKPISYSEFKNGIERQHFLWENISKDSKYNLETYVYNDNSKVTSFWFFGQYFCYLFLFYFLPFASSIAMLGNMFQAINIYQVHAANFKHVLSFIIAL